MMPESIDSQKARRRHAIFSACCSALWQIAVAVVLLWIRGTEAMSLWLWWLLTICAIGDLLLLIPLTISLKQRLKEIQGGEEDEAHQY